jgi:putative hydrolase of HD superfamily
MPNTPSALRLIDLQRLTLHFIAIERQLTLPATFGEERLETDVEHSFALALAAWFLAQNAPHLDTNKVIRYALVHDLVEVHAGDTYAYDPAAHRTKKQREKDALATLQIDWPDFPEMTDAITAFEEQWDPEARFVYALDKIMPIILNMLDSGRPWHRKGVTLKQMRAYKDKKVAVSSEIAALYDQLIGILEKNPQYFPSK